MTPADPAISWGGCAHYSTTLMREVPWNIARGFLMGAADIVPGVSGGTIALVVGIYTRFVESIKDGSSALFAFARFRGAEGVGWLRKVDWYLIAPLGVGILLAVLTLAHVIETQLEERPIQMAALFVGLVGGSIVVAWQALQKRDGLRLAVLAGTGILVFLLLGVREGTSDETVSQLAEPAMWVFFAAGAVAIWAMVLPGISGSFILVMLGMYGPVLNAVNDRDLATVGVFLVGTVIGLAVFSQILHRALREHYNTVMAVLIGLMLGSMRVLWPWPDGVDSTGLGAPDEATTISVVLALFAFVVVIGLNEIASRRDGRTEQRVTTERTG
jgi:putative membrane protein